MTTSNSYDFTVTRDQLITDALLHIGGVGEGEAPSAAAVTEAARLLNMTVKLRASEGMPTWALKRASLLPVTDSNTQTTLQHIVSAFNTTTISANEASGQTTISVTSGTSIVNGDQIGIEQDDGTMHWTTVASGEGTSTPVITAALTEAASAGNYVYFYTASTDRIPRPIRIIDAYIQNIAATNYEIDVVDKNYYLQNSPGVNTDASIPNIVYYEAGLGDNGAPDNSTAWYGTVHFYPQFFGGDNYITFTYQRPFQDFNAASDNPDFPPEFYLPLMLELAALLGPRYGVLPTERARLFSEAKAYRDIALESIYSEGSLYLQPDRLPWQ